MIDLRRLRVLAEHGTVTATAAALHLTPSAVSHQLRQLGRDLSVDLLSHEGRNVRLTPAARRLLEHADVLNAQWEHAKADLAGHAHQVAGTVTICGVSSALAAFVAPALPRLADACPRLDVRVVEEESVDCYQLLTTQGADVAVVLPTPDAPPVTDPRFDQQPLFDDPQDLLVARSHPLALRDAVDLSDAAAEDWIVKSHHNDTYPLLTAACAAAGFTPRVTHEVKEWYAVSAFVARGLGVCLLPRLVPTPSEHAVTRLPLHGAPVLSRRFVTCTRRGSSGHPAVSAVLSALREATAGLPPPGPG
ncbi:LysR family transcriptional regulator [Pseudonocardia parietis]|uniref:DNA-binding transcriptional LysR family regulator n=1 Tax=Pseudonocardia parietis TaxID=570936 RepID=A0ABS4VR51_9PSEU|nr:LysR family transcriptional regulator [Pseudonocardia parietis]MBP2366410.1 DNA-binding transcriptional LysR family regulator [Pseudonocardia parietis]